MTTPSSFKRSLEYRRRTRSKSRDYDHVSQQIANALEKNDQQALQALINKKE